MTSRRNDNAVRGVMFALTPALAAWALLALVGFALAMVVPVWVLVAVTIALVGSFVAVGLHAIRHSKQ